MLRRTGRMRRIVGNIEATVLAHATEDESKVLKCFRIVFPEDVQIRRDMLRGHYGNPIVKFSGGCRGKKAQACFDSLVRRMSRRDLEVLVEKLGSKLDNSCHLHLRFCKQKAYDGNVKLSEGDDVVHVKVKVLARPAKAEKAAHDVRDYLLEVLSCEGKGEDT